MTKPRHRTELRARLVSTVLALLCLGLAYPPVSSAQPATPAPITVLLGTSGVSWNDVSVSTPNLLNAASWSAGSLAARSVGAFSCPVDGWLAVSAGARARGRKNQDECDNRPQPWSALVAQAHQDPYRASPGLLGRTLTDAGVHSFGIGPGARVTLADPSGRPVGTWQARSERLGEQVRTAVVRLREAGGTGGRLLVVDLGDVSPAQRATQTTAVDARFGQVLSEVPEDSTILLASLADGSAEPHLQATAMRRPRDRAGLLTSESTRQPGYVTATDVTPTLLASLGVEPPVTLTGSAITGGRSPAWSGERLTLLRDPDLKAQQMHRVVPYFVVITYVPILGILGWLWWRARKQQDPHWPATVRPFASFVALIPAATYLANLVAWWRSGAGLLMVEAAVLIIAAGLSLPLLVGSPRLPAHLRPWAFLGWPGLVTGVVFAVDLLNGSRLQMSSMIGLQPLVAGRFYGLGNPQFAIFGTSAVLLAGAISGWLLTRRPTPADDHWSQPRRISAAATLTIGVLALALDAAPGLGSDFGGPPALLPAILLLTTLILGFTVTWRRVAVAALVTLTLSVTVCLLDWLRPAGQRTHLGRVVQTAMDGDLAPVIGRKLGTNLGLLVAAPYNLLIPAVTVLGAWYLLRPRAVVLEHTYGRAPVVRHMVAAWFVMLTIAFLLNDSGVVVPPLAGLLMLPALLAFLPWPNRAGGPLPQAALQD